MLQATFDVQCHKLANLLLNFPLTSVYRPVL